MLISENANGCHLNQMTPITNYENPCYRGLSLDHVRGLGSLGTCGDVEFDLIALSQRLESIALDRGKMHKHIFAIFLLNKAKAL